MLAYGTGCHMSSFVVIEQELHEKFEVAHYPTMAHDPTGVSSVVEASHEDRRARECSFVFDCLPYFIINNNLRFLHSGVLYRYALLLITVRCQ
jgi:hypothetical protein